MFLEWEPALYASITKEMNVTRSCHPNHHTEDQADFSIWSACRPAVSPEHTSSVPGATLRY
jgi:hypothetical protein